jgi:hypothetical protein
MVAAHALGLPALSASVTRPVRDALPFPANDPRYSTSALVPGRPPFELSFVEAEPAAIRFDFEPSGPACSPATRRERAIAIMRCWSREVGNSAAAGELEESLSSLAHLHVGPRATFGAFVGAACDARGLSQAKIYFELGGELPSDYPVGLANVAHGCCSRVPGLVPHFASLACGRDRCVPRLYMLCVDDVPLVALRYALAAAGLEHSHAELVARTMALCGGGGVLPAGGAVLSFSDDRGRTSCKLELLARALPLPRAALERRVGHVVWERPEMRAALHRWSRAHRGNGIVPGEITVVGFRVGTANPARLGIYVSPAEWSPSCAS